MDTSLEILVRRGFRIYPPFHVLLGLTLLILGLSMHFSPPSVWSAVLFLQDYVPVRLPLWPPTHRRRADRGGLAQLGHARADLVASSRARTSARGWWGVLTATVALFRPKWAPGHGRCFLPGGFGPSIPGGDRPPSWVPPKAQAV